MTTDSTPHVRLPTRRAILLGAGLTLGTLAASTANAQLAPAIDLSSRSARLASNPWQSQLAISPFARFDHARFSVDGRWTAYGAEGQRLNGFGSASATYFSRARAGLQLSVSGFANRDLLNETFAVSRFGTDARLSYKTGRSGVWLGRELSRDNKSTPISAAPRASAGAWTQWGNAVLTVSMSAFGGREQVLTQTTRKVPNQAKVGAPAGVRDTLQDSIQVTTSDTTNRGRNWSDAEVSFHWGAGRLAFRSVVGARFLTAHQPNELWGQVLGTYAMAGDVALIASAGVHPSSAAYGVSRARYMQLGFRIAPNALLKPRLPTSVRPAAVAFEVKDADRGLRTLRIRVPSARTVELSGDFTGWKPITLTRGDDDRWETTIPIAPGMHRLAIRVDGDAWTPPPGVTTVPDEFQGTVGVIVVK
jgi:hypothetical protein